MRPAQFISELAKLSGKDVATLTVIDRALADAGMRTKARGRRVPDLLPQEGIHFLLAILSGRPATRVADSARDLGRFQLLDGQQPSDVQMFAEMLRTTPERLREMDLIEVIRRLCLRLALGVISPRAAEVAVEQGSWVTISVDADSALVQLAFVGATDLDRSGVRQINIAQKPVLEWLGRASGAAFWGEDADE